MLSVGNDELGEKIGQTESCPNCKQSHEVRTTDILSFVVCGEKTLLIGINGQRLPTRNPKSAAQPLDKELLGVRAIESPDWEWRDGMQVLRWSRGKPDHLVPEGRVGNVDRRRITSTSIPDLEDAATRGALLGLLRDLIGDSTLSPMAYRSDEGDVLWRFGYALGRVPSWVKHLLDSKSEAELLVRALLLVRES